MNSNHYKKLDPRIRYVLLHLERKFNTELSLDAIAQDVNLSCSRLRHLFKEQVGRTPLQHLKALKMEEAQKLADQTFLSVKQIMHRVGINDESHFVKDFKSVHGATVTRYRQARKM